MICLCVSSDFSAESFTLRRVKPFCLTEAQRACFVPAKFPGKSELRNRANTCETSYCCGIIHPGTPGVGVRCYSTCGLQVSFVSSAFFHRAVGRYTTTHVHNKHPEIIHASTHAYDTNVKLCLPSIVDQPELSSCFPLGVYRPIRPYK